MANGNLVKLLLKTNVSQYLEWKCVDGTFVYQWDKPMFGKAKGVIRKVPSNSKGAFSSDLMGLFEKNRCRSKILISKTLRPTQGMTLKLPSRT